MQKIILISTASPNPSEGGGQEEGFCNLEIEKKILYHASKSLPQGGGLDGALKL